MPSLDEELKEIQIINDIETCKKRKAARKGQYTRIYQQLQALSSTPYRSLQPREVERRAAEAKRAAALFTALQERHEDLLADQPALQAEEVERSLSIRGEHEALLDKAEALRDKVELYHNVSVLLEDFLPLLDTPTPNRPIYQTTFASLQSRATEFKRHARQYMADPDIEALVGEINQAMAKYQKAAAEAHIESALPPLLSSTTSTLTRESSEPARTINITSRLKLDLPKFNGELTEWLGFKALFTAAMERDGAGVSEHEKCIHLLSCMTSHTAKQTVKQFATSADGYTQALQALEDAYGGSWRIYPQHVSALLKDETYHYTAEGLRKMRETLDVNLKGLEECGGDTLQQFVAAMIISRFDRNMTYEWSHYWEDLATLPTIQEVRDFFRKRELRMVDNTQ